MLSVPCFAEIVDRVVALVNNDIILQSDLENKIRPFYTKLTNQGYTEAQARAIVAKQRSVILEQMINEKLTDQQVEKHNITVSEDEVSATIERIQQANKLTGDEFERMLTMEGLTFEEYRDQIKEQLQQTRLLNREVRSKIIITEQDIKAYYEANKSKYVGQTKYHLRHLLIKAGPSANKFQKENAYQQTVRLHQRLQAGEDFAQLADTYSQAPAAGPGGDLGVFESRLLASRIREALQDMSAGQFSQVVETEQGYQIFYLEEIIRAGGKTLEEVTPEIQEKLFAQIVDERFKEWLKDLRQRAHLKILD